jgi:hypothetical protein
MFGDERLNLCRREVILANVDTHDAVSCAA